MSNQSLDHKQGIYVELDALMDTRLAILNKMHGDAVVDVLKNGYFTRRTDTFHNTSKEEFDALYKARDKTILADAVVTKVIGFIRELVMAMNNQAIESPMHAGPRVVLNVYPYVLTEAEQNVLVRGLAVATSKFCDVECVYMAPEQLVPVWVKKHLSVMFIYDYAPFLEAQGHALDKRRAPEISVMVPGIYFNREPTDQEMREAVDEGMHPLKAIEFVSSPLIGLKLQDIELFCVNIPTKK